MPPITPDLKSFDAITPNINAPIECSSRGVWSGTAAAIALMLLFYALALWDRYLHLQMREAETSERRLLREGHRALPFYGTSLPSNPPRLAEAGTLVLPKITITPPPSPISEKQTHEAESRFWGPPAAFDGCDGRTCDDDDRLAVSTHEISASKVDSTHLFPPRTLSLQDVAL
ncbi:hypothetical protein HMN09_01179200 [Mycena chlorophos]|uniref:Uncharacterized protein n=1 Tax=Mycena chlorophos TaxID=658473 RepID=A0A8H6S6Q9_MYCCL|nr:hypothetical protein HMN09_01179200 [Mycena chlorophos]